MTSEECMIHVLSCRNLALRVCKVPLSEAYTDDLGDEKNTEDTTTFTPETVIKQ